MKPRESKWRLHLEFSQRPYKQVNQFLHWFCVKKSLHGTSGTFCVWNRISFFSSGFFCCCFLFSPIIQLYLLQVKTWSALSEEKKPPSTHKETRRKNKNAPLLISSVLFNLSREESWSANHMYRNFGEVFRQMELVFFFFAPKIGMGFSLNFSLSLKRKPGHGTGNPTEWCRKFPLFR